MNQEERNKRKQKWMAHGFMMAKLFRESGSIIESLLKNVSEGANDFDSFTTILAEMETILHECGIASFTEKYMLFKLADVELRSSSGP